MIAKGTRSGFSNVEVSGAYIKCFYTFDVVKSLYFPFNEIAVVAWRVCRDKFIGADGPTHRSTYRIFGSTSGSLGLTQTHSTHALF